MKKTFLSSYFLLFTFAVLFANAGQPNKKANLKLSTKGQADSLLPITEGGSSYALKFLEQQNVSKDDVLQKMRSKNVNKRSGETDSLILISSETDNMGITHSKYKQQINGVPIDGNILIIHEKNESVLFINGQYFENISIETTPMLSNKKAIKLFLANNDSALFNYNETIKSELVIAPKGGVYKKENLYLCYKVFTPKWIYFIDANTGEFINKLTNTFRISTNIQAKTLYSGVQTISTDYKNGTYYLYDSVRNIYTYDGTNDETWIDGNPFANPKIIHEKQNPWDQFFYISDVTITYVNKNILGETDDVPDLYLEVLNDKNELIYVSSVVYNKNPEVDFPSINVPIANSTNFLLRIIDKDNSSESEVCGEIEFTPSSTSIEFQNNNVAGFIKIKGESGNLAADIHWGMAQTYDYFWETFKRKSFDGGGDTIHNFLNPNLISDWDNNNAFSLHTIDVGMTIDIMCYGLGDGVYMNPVVSLDIIAHEFTHLITSYTSQLYYQGESGAMNEAFSDMLATCVEYYAKGNNANWTIGEGAIVPTPFLRSLENPKSSDLIGYLQTDMGTMSVDMRQPDTYKGEYWQNTFDLNNDYGGVHNNSGVINYWFYLLTEGGSGINDLDLEYYVEGIGIEKSEQIVYNTLISYLTPTASFNDMYYATLSVTEALFGADTPEWWSVKNAWYAVGVNQTDPNAFCSGQITFTEPSGTITDGSGDANYAPNSSCRWLIAPPGATRITLKVTEMDIMDFDDGIIIYSSIIPNPNVVSFVGQGTALPANDIVIEGGAALIEFISDDIDEKGGWTIEYTTTTVPVCHGSQILTEKTGTISDNSDPSENYGNNQECLWGIAPAGMDSLLLDFNYFATELDYDFLYVYNAEPKFGNEYDLIATYTGTDLPEQLMIYSDEVWIKFTSDPFANDIGFELEYSAFTSPFCSGTKTLTADYGTISDGSGDDAYYRNSECGWLIQPEDALSITLMFDEVYLESPEADGRTYYDYITIYDGDNADAPVIGKYAGSDVPPSIQSSGNAMFITFKSNMNEEFDGFSAHYMTETETFCNTETLTQAIGTINDGSEDKQYGNNTNCTVLIDPEIGAPINLKFDGFSTELGKDFVRIYDGTDTSATLLGEFSGNNLPESVTAQSGTMLLWFSSDEYGRDNGWSATYTAESALVQQIELEKGWNLVSFYVHPTETSIESVFGSSFSSIETIKTDDGFYNVYLPKYINSLWNIEGGQAYVIHSKDAVTISVKGTSLTNQVKTSISSLQAGWQMKGNPFSALSEFELLFDLQSVESIKNFDGFFIPDNSLNSIENLIPGKGYFVKGK